MEYQELLADLIKKSKRAGADQAEIYLEEGKELQLRVRKGQLEILKESQTRGLGMRFFSDKKLGFSYTSDFSVPSLEKLIEKTLFLAKNSSQDEFGGLPQTEKPSLEGDLKIYDTKLAGFPFEKKKELAQKAEESAFALDPRISNSEGAGYSDQQTKAFLANSLGMNSSFERTSIALSCSPVAEKNGEKRGGFSWDHKSFLGDLELPEKIGKTAAQRALAMLGSKVIQTTKVPIVFDSLTAAWFLGGLSSGVNGEAVSKNSTIFADKLGKKIGSDLLTVWDDGLMLKGVGSRPFDGEGVPTSRKKIFENGVLLGFLHNSYSARKMKTISTGNASRGYNSIPEISSLNLYLENGKTPPEEIIKSVEKGFYVTDLAGFGMNMVTGDYSQMAEGLWIENGELTYPVSGVTIAGTILEMIKGIEMVGNDLYFRGDTACPTLKFSPMIVAGR